MRRIITVFTTGILIFLLFYGIAAGQNSEKIINALKIDKKPVMDGYLNDKSWQKVHFNSDFLQKEPVDRGEPTQKTAIGMMYDKNNLYIGVKCFDTEPEKIIAKEMRRDNWVDDDDNFEMVFDTFHDQRNGFYFITNPFGSKRDAMLSDEGNSYNPNWDGIWECKSKITDEGWFLEIAIPWKTLRFKESDNMVWGFNCSRTVRRTNEKMLWSYIPRDAGHGGIFKLSYAGIIKGMKNIKMGGNTEITPYVVSGAENDVNTDNETESEFDAGFDAKINLTANLAANLSVNTDFAQVESDDEQVNLTRFSLYFAEKREFFLEGDEQFKFGSFSRGYGGGGYSSSLSLFYSRRIGIEGGHKVPIYGGGRVIGKIGNYSVGFLNMQTKRTSFLDYDNLRQTVESANYSVLRVKRDILDRSSIGMMLLNKEVNNSDHYNRGIGFDSRLSLTDQFSMTGSVSATFSPDVSQDDGPAINMNRRNLAGTFSAGYRSDLWQMSGNYLEIGKNFNAEIGFVPRTDIRKLSTSVEYSPRPKNPGRIKKFKYQIEFSYMSDQTGAMLDRNEGVSFGIEFNSGARINIGAERFFENIDYDWEVRENILVPARGYTSYGYSVSANTDKSRPVVLSGSVNLEDYYGGDRKGLNSGFSFNKIRHLLFSLDYRYNDISLPTGSFKTNTVSSRISWMFTTDLYVKAYLQWNDDKLRYYGRERMINNIMLRYIYKPGSNFYLVYNEGKYLGGSGDETFNWTLLGKFTYFFRK